MESEVPNIILVEKAFHDKGLRICSFDRMLIAVVIGIVFFLLAMPLAFRLSNAVGSRIRVPTVRNGSPTLIGLIIHTILFIIVVRLLML